MARYGFPDSLFQILPSSEKTVALLGCCNKVAWVCNYLQISVTTHLVFGLGPMWPLYWHTIRPIVSKK